MRVLSQFLRSICSPVFSPKRSTRRLRSRMSTTAAFVETCEPRELLSTISIGTLTPQAPTVERIGSITTTNGSDEYTFHINDTAQVRVAISGLRDDLNVGLFGPDFSPIGSSKLSGVSIDGFVTTTIGTTGSTTGPYRVRVGRGPGVTVSNYFVSVSIAPDSDDVITNATDLGSLDSAESTMVSRSGVVGTVADLADHYRFTLVQSSSNFRAFLGGPGSKTVDLLDGAGRVLAINNGGALERSNLAAGEYFLRVSAPGSATPRSYDLSVTAKLGTIDIFGTPKVSIVGSVGGGAAPEDNAAFSIAAAGSFEFELKNQTTAVGYDIRNDSDQVVFSAAANSSPNRSITTLPAGNYRIRVFSGTGLVSPYSLSGAVSMTGSWSNAGQIDPSLKPTIRFQPPLSQISVDGKSWRGLVSTTAATPLKLNLLPLSGVPAGASLSMLAFNSAGTLLAWNNSSDGSYLEATLPTTSPDVRIFVVSTATLQPGFELSVTSDLVGDDQFSGAPSAELTLTTPTDRRTGVTGNTADIIDSYRVNLQSAGRFLAVLSGMTANLNLEVLNSKGRRIASSSQTGTTFDQVLTQELPADDYFVRVVTPYFGLGAAPTTASPYVLDTTIDTLSDDTLIGSKEGGTIRTSRPTYTFTAPEPSILAPRNIQDYHMFTLDAQRDIRINLSGFNRDLDVELMNLQGVVLQTGQSSGLTAEDFVKTGLSAGIYFVRVFRNTPNESLSSRYQLVVTQKPRPVAPSGVDTSIFMHEDTQRGVRLTDFPFTDADTPSNALLNVKITTLPAKGSLALTDGLGTITDVTEGQLIPAAAIATNQLVFRPASNEHGAPYTSFTFQVQDNGAVVSGDADFDLSRNTITFNVRNVNDAPTLGANSTMPAILEDTTDPAGMLLTALSSNISDIDPASQKGIAVLALDNTNGTWQFSLNGTTWQNFGSVSVTTSRLLPLDATTRIRFVPNPNFNTGNTPLTLSYGGWDQTSGSAGAVVDTSVVGGTTAFSVATRTISHSVTKVNDAPVLTSEARTLPLIDEDAVFIPGPFSGARISSMVVNATDVDTNAQKGIAIFEASTAGGRWQYSVTNGEVWLDVGTVSLSSARLLRNLTSHRVRFKPDANASGQATLKFHAWDITQGADNEVFDLSGLNKTGGTTAFSIVSTTAIQNVRAMNDAPTVTAPISQNVAADTPLVFSTANENRVFIGDVEAVNQLVQMTITATNGTLTLPSTVQLTFVSGGNGQSTFTVSGRVGMINEALAGAIYTPNVRSFGNSSLTISVNDQGNTGFGGPLSATKTVALSVALPSNTVALGGLSATTPTIRRSGNRDGSTATPDFYTFTIAAASDVRVNLSGLSADVDVRVFSSGGQMLGQSLFFSNTIENILMTALPAGTYLVDLRGQVVSAYDLTLSTVPTSDDLITQATVLATPTAATLPTVRQQDFATAADLQDYYKFSLTAASALRINLSGLSQNVDFELLDSAGRVIQSASAIDNEIVNMLTSSLAVGTYYVRVFAFEGLLTSSYDLTISTNTTSDDLLTNATSLGILGLKGSDRRTGNVATGTDIQDYYAFAGSGDVAISLSGLSSDVDVQVLDRFGRVLASSTNGGNSFESINLNIPSGSGTIFIRVFAFSGSSNYVLEARNNSNAANADDLLSTATVLPNPITSLSRTGAVGGSGSTGDPQDYYRFELSTVRNVTVTLTGLSADLDIEVLDQFGNLLFFGRNGGSSSETINMANLGIGTYFIRIHPFGSAISNYTLGLTV